MRIVLRQDVPNLGEAGTVQVVANGYARNFLIPRGMAALATVGELKSVENQQRVTARKIAKQEHALQALADKVSGQRLSFTARSGEQGRLYGSITAGDIADQLSSVVGEEIDRRRVVLDEPIRSLGAHQVVVHLVGRLRPEITVVVTSENEEDAVQEASDDVETSNAAPDDAMPDDAAMDDPAVAEIAELEN